MRQMAPQGDGVVERVAGENEVVLKDPATQVIFHEFGESALNFWLYYYLPHRDFYLDTVHRLHMN